MISEKKQILCTFCRHGSEQWFIMKWSILDLLDVVWSIYDIHVFPSCHHKRYVGRNVCDGLSHEIFFVPFVFPSWLEMALGSHQCPASILARRAQPRKSQQGQGIGPFSL